jgi:hypothetical protein
MPGRFAVSKNIHARKGPSTDGPLFFSRIFYFHIRILAAKGKDERFTWLTWMTSVIHVTNMPYSVTTAAGFG